STGQPEQPAFPAQWVYGLYVISSVHRACWPPSPRVRRTRLDPSVGGSGPHDFAVRDPRFVLRAPRPSHPAPNVRDDREPPLWRKRDGRRIRVIWDSGKANYFRWRGLNGGRELEWLVKLVFWR